MAGSLLIVNDGWPLFSVCASAGRNVFVALCAGSAGSKIDDKFVRVGERS